MVKVKIVCWGNSSAVRLSATWVCEAGLAAGDDLEPTIEAANVLTLPPRRTFAVAALLAETDAPRTSLSCRPQLSLL